MNQPKPRIRLCLLGPAIAFIVATTMIPTGLRHPSLIHLANHFELIDVVNNLILYMPLGLALAESSLLRAFLVGLLLSTLAETLQLGYVDRIPSFIDVACNTAGTLMGYFVARWLRSLGRDPRWLTIPRWFAIAALPVAVLSTIMLLVHRPPSDFSNWSADAHLLVGNEVTGNRAWAGTISALQIYPAAMTPEQISGLAAGVAALPANQDALSLFPAGGLLPPAATTPRIGQPLLSHDEELAFFEALHRQGRMTLLVVARPADIDQSGPARIVTYSQGPFDRNFTLGQVKSGLTFRLRTPVSGMNGTEPALYTGPALTADHASFLAAVYDGRNSSLFVDGKQASRTDLGQKRPHLPKRVLAELPGSVPIRVIELSATEMFSSSLLALGLIALPGISNRRVLYFLLGTAAGLAVGGTIWIFAVSNRGLGLRIVMECLLGGWMIAASVRVEAPKPAVIL